MNKQQSRNRRWKVFNRGALRLCGGAWHSKNWQKLPWFTGFHISIWRLGALFGGLSPPKPPWRRDWADCGQKSNKLQVILFFLQVFMNECSSCYYCS